MAIELGSVLPLVSLRNVERLLRQDRQCLRQTADRAARYYRSFDMRRLDAAKPKWRHIDNPCGLLREIQQNIHRRILRQYPFPETMMGGVSKGTIIKNARVHARQPVIVALDIRNCFPSATNAVVYRAYRHCLGCSPGIARLLTRLTTFHRRIPQGAPTSTLLANLVLLPLHDDVKEVAERRRLNFTFYVDDIVLSGQGAEHAIEEVIRAVQRHGFSAANAKKKLMRGNELQFVTGLVVNRRPNVSNAYTEKLRSEILVAARSGTMNQGDLRSFLGRISHVRAINPLRADSLRRLLTRVLPEAVRPGRKVPNIEYRRCKCAKRHRVVRAHSRRTSAGKLRLWCTPGHTGGSTDVRH
jgi:hypothetical protein